MPPSIASIIFTIGIMGLFFLDRHEDSRVSKALWIPASWLFLISSRPASLWLGMSQSNMNGVDATAAFEEGSPFDRNVFMILLLAALAVLVLRQYKVGPLLKKNALILLFFLFCAVSIVWSDFPLVAFKRWIKALGDLGMVLIILTEADPLSALKRLLARLGFLIFPLSVLFIKYYLEIGRRLTQGWTEEAVGVATQKNGLGLDCMMYGVFFLWMFVSTYRGRDDPGRRRRLLAYGTIIGMIIWLLNQCNSTTSITGLVCAGAVMWFASRPSRKPAVVHLLVLAVIGLAVTAVYLDPGGGMVEALGKDPTLTGRTEIWHLVLGLHTNPWIGTGFESFWLGPRLDKMRNAMPNFPINEAHNGYLEVYLNLGWAGVCFVVLLLVTGYNRVISGIRRNPERASLFLGFLLCALFYSFTEAAFRLMAVAWVFLLLVIVGGSQAVPLTSSPPTGLAHAGDIRADQEPAYATQRTSLDTH
ncbi:MAG: O-antigen ligase family protein [Candidatus Acidiferrum sp.]